MSEGRRVGRGIVSVTNFDDYAFTEAYHTAQSVVSQGQTPTTESQVPLSATPYGQWQAAQTTAAILSQANKKASFDPFAALKQVVPGTIGVKSTGEAIVGTTAVAQSSAPKKSFFERQNISAQAAKSAAIKRYSASQSARDAAKQRRVDVTSILGDYDSSDEEASPGPWHLSASQVAEETAEKESLHARAAAAAAAKLGITAAAEAEENPETLEELPPGVFILEPTTEEERWERVEERKLGSLLPPRPKRGSLPSPTTTQFLGAAATDFEGRAWCARPKGLPPLPEQPTDEYDEDLAAEQAAEAASHKNAIPSSNVLRIEAHTKGVAAVEFSPHTGHLMLSAGMDGTCKIWSLSQCLTTPANESRVPLMRTYTGHTEAVRNVQFSHDSSSFLSTGYDRYIRLWDTETGAAKATFSNRKMAYAAKFCPRDENIFITACNNHRLYQWDIRTGTVVQEYNYHLNAVSTLLFLRDGERFVSTSDDRKMLVWAKDVPVPVKYIQEPDIHSMPALALHPTENYFAAQSMDNKLVVYSAGEKIRAMKRKVFKGHNSAGFACQPGFSPNGKFVVSGDGCGEVFFWDWHTTKLYKRLRGHTNGPAIGVAWHPLHKTRVASCGWDGAIQIYE